MIEITNGLELEGITEYSANDGHIESVTCHLIFQGEEGFVRVSINNLDSEYPIYDTVYTSLATRDLIKEVLRDKNVWSSLVNEINEFIDMYNFFLK